MDLFNLDKRWYLLVYDYYSLYPEIMQLRTLKETEIILHLKAIFARHGNPEIVFSGWNSLWTNVEVRVHSICQRLEFRP